MHLEILVEDQSGEKALEILLPKIVNEKATYRIRSYKGVGHIPKNMKDPKEVKNRLLLENLPKLLRGYGKTFYNYPNNYPAAVIFICDLDDKCLKEFRQELFRILDNCDPKPETCFCIAIEEGESWLLGDLPAVKKAYPRAKDNVLNAYDNDSICGTWELLADALYPGGSQQLSKEGWQAIGAEKSKWAKQIAPNMDVTNNDSPSFCYFRDKLLNLI
jgi:hypothetical protein